MLCLYRSPDIIIEPTISRNSANNVPAVPNSNLEGNQELPQSGSVNAEINLNAILSQVSSLSAITSSHSKFIFNALYAIMQFFR